MSDFGIYESEDRFQQNVRNDMYSVGLKLTNYGTFLMTSRGPEPEGSEGYRRKVKRNGTLMGCREVSYCESRRRDARPDMESLIANRPLALTLSRIYGAPETLH